MHATTSSESVQINRPVPACTKISLNGRENRSRQSVIVPLRGRVDPWRSIGPPPSVWAIQPVGALRGVRLERRSHNTSDWGRYLLIFVFPFQYSPYGRRQAAASRNTKPGDSPTQAKRCLRFTRLLFMLIIFLNPQPIRISRGCRRKSREALSDTILPIEFPSPELRKRYEARVRPAPCIRRASARWPHSIPCL